MMWRLGFSEYIAHNSTDQECCGANTAGQMPVKAKIIPVERIFKSGTSIGQIVTERPCKQ